MDEQTQREIKVILEWFEGRGLGMKLTDQLDGFYWADLTRLSDGGVVAPRYGRGDRPLMAARSAQRRYLEEQ